MIARELFKASKSIRSEFIALFRELIYLKSFVKARYMFLFNWLVAFLRPAEQVAF